MSEWVGIEEAGRRSITIVEVDGAWRVRFSDAADDRVLGFGPALYGGTRKQAETDAERIADKWDFKYVPPEASA